MKTTESNLLTRANKMGESTLVTLSDWELAYLRVAMIHQVEEALEASLVDRCSDPDVAGGRDVRQGVEAAGVCVLEDLR